MSQKELGKRVGVGQTAVAAWEIGRAVPGYQARVKLARIFGVSLSDLFDDQSVASDPETLTQLYEGVLSDLGILKARGEVDTARLDRLIALLDAANGVATQTV